MSYQFNDEDREEVNFQNGMPFGVTKVQLLLAEAGTTEKGKEYIEITVADANGVEDAARVWFVGGASKFSFNTLRDILVHQGKTEEEKEALRQAANTAADAEALCALLNEKVGGELWFTKYYDAKGGTYTNEYGTFKSTNKNIYGYEPQEKPELMPSKDSKGDGGEQVHLDTLGDAEDITKTDAAGAVPKNWAK
jgi:hypothetical protein